MHFADLHHTLTELLKKHGRSLSDKAAAGSSVPLVRLHLGNEFAPTPDSGARNWTANSHGTVLPPPATPAVASPQSSLSDPSSPVPPNLASPTGVKVDVKSDSAAKEGDKKDGDKKDGDKKDEKKEPPKVAFSSLFRYPPPPTPLPLPLHSHKHLSLVGCVCVCSFADSTDKLLVFCGVVGAMVMGAALPVFSIVFGTHHFLSRFANPLITRVCAFRVLQANSSTQLRRLPVRYTSLPFSCTQH
jgi:hypothetical protein